MSKFDKTMKFSSEEIPKQNVEMILKNVYNTLEERGYHPENQIVGYLLSGDPAYIPRHNEARNQIRQIDRDEIMKELVTFYLNHNHEGNHA
ncbi:IreB family regulatory phosphoprotein [Staphylococcus sp. 11261D007BR]